MEHTVTPAPDTATAPDLSTPEGRWAYVLTVWHTHSLPTPESISVGEGSEIGSVWLPRNERGQVDGWLAALNGGPATISSLTRRSDGANNRSAHYGQIADGFHIACFLDLTADAEAHGGPLVPPEPSELAVAAANVTKMLTTPTDAGDTSGPQLSSAWQNEDGTVGCECRCRVTFDGFDRKGAKLLDELFAKHECNTLPPACGWIGGCTYGVDGKPAPAEDDENLLCTTHRAEVFPELAGATKKEEAPCEYGCTDSISDATCPTHGVLAFLTAQREQEFGGAL